jgi:hypothetical protein
MSIGFQKFITVLTPKIDKKVKEANVKVPLGTILE